MQEERRERRFTGLSILKRKREKKEEVYGCDEGGFAGGWQGRERICCGDE